MGKVVHLLNSVHGKNFLYRQETSFWVHSLNGVLLESEEIRTPWDFHNHMQSIEVKYQSQTHYDRI